MLQDPIFTSLSLNSAEIERLLMTILVDKNKKFNWLSRIIVKVIKIKEKMLDILTGY
jgi:hypothetical protein